MYTQEENISQKKEKNIFPIVNSLVIKKEEKLQGFPLTGSLSMLDKGKAQSSLKLLYDIQG